MSRRASRIQRGQAGASLMEVLVGIAVMVPLTLASVSGLLVQMKVSTGTQTAQRLEVELTEAGEDLASIPYLSCGAPKHYQELLDGWSSMLGPELVADRAGRAVVMSVEYWYSAKGVFLPECHGDDGAQRLTVSVTDGDRTTTGTIVKRNPAARQAGAR